MLQRLILQRQLRECHRVLGFAVITSSWNFAIGEPPGQAWRPERRHFAICVRVGKQKWNGNEGEIIDRREEIRMESNSDKWIVFW